jgi:hypothetical protein
MKTKFVQKGIFITIANFIYNFTILIYVVYVFVRDAPDTVFAGYPANPKAGYRISGRMFVLTNIVMLKYKIILFKSFNNYILQQI